MTNDAFSLQSKYHKTDIEVNTLRKDLNLKEQEARQNQSKLETRIQELETLQRTFRSNFSYPLTIDYDMTISDHFSW